MSLIKQVRLKTLLNGSDKIVLPDVVLHAGSSGSQKVFLFLNFELLIALFSSISEKDKNVFHRNGFIRIRNILELLAD